MALQTITVSSSYIPDLIQDANAQLAALTAVYIRSISFQANETSRIASNEITLIIVYESGASAHNAYQLNVFAAQQNVAVSAALQAFQDANPSYWFGPTIADSFTESRRTSRYLMCCIYNTVLADGQTYYVPGGTGGPGGGGSGTVTSVGLSLPSIFTVTGSPVTTAGTLTGTLAAQTANTLCAGPTTGAAASPTFRALVGADYPALTVPVGSINATGTPTASTFLRGDGAWVVPAGGGTIGGSIATNQVAVGSGANTIAGSAALVWTVGTGLSSNRPATSGTEAFGLSAGNTTMTGLNNTLVGASAGAALTSGAQNIFIGSSAALLNQSGSRNIIIGYQGWQTATSGDDNIVIGTNAMNVSTTGARNVVIGTGAMVASTNIVDAVLIGYHAGQGAGASGVLIGRDAGILMTADNTAVGRQAGNQTTSGTGNVFLGSFAGDATAAAASNRFVVGGASAGFGIADVYIGAGETNSVAVGSITYHATGGSGADKAGASFTIAGGISTGAGLGGAINFQTSKAATTSSTPNALTTRLSVLQDGGIDWTGIATVSAPAVSAANHGTIYYDRTLQLFQASVNGGAYATLGGGASISGTPAANQVAVWASASAITGLSNLTTTTTALVYTQSVATSGAPTAFTVTGGAHTTLTASAEIIDVNLNLNRTINHANGAITTQRSFVVSPPVHSFVSGSNTIATATTMSITGAPSGGSFATITTAIALDIESGLLRTAAATTSVSGFRVPHGSAPTSPVNGDIWTTASGLFVRLNGTTISISSSAVSGTGTSGQIAAWNGTSTITGFSGFTCSGSTVVNNFSGFASSNVISLATTMSLLTGGSGGTHLDCYAFDSSGVGVNMVGHATRGTGSGFTDNQAGDNIMAFKCGGRGTGGATQLAATNAALRFQAETNGGNSLGTISSICVLIEPMTTAGAVVHSFGAYSNGSVTLGGTAAIQTLAGVYTLAKLYTLASTTSLSSINLPHGTAPSSPVNGDMWTTTAGLFLQVNGSTVGPLAAGVSGSGTANSVTVWSGTSAITKLTAFTATDAAISYTQAAQTSGTARMFTLIGGAHTGLTASNEVNDIQFDMGRTVQWATGNITNQRAALFTAPTYSFVGASVITTAATLSIAGAPIAGTNATITNTYALWVSAGNVLIEAALTVNSQFIMTGGQSNSATGMFQLAPSVIATNGTPTLIRVQGAANTGMTASTEVFDINLNLGRVTQWATGNITNQRAVVLQTPAYAFVGASVITNAATFAINGAPIASTNATITNTYAIWIQSGLAAFDGMVKITGTSLGSAVSNGSVVNIRPLASNAISSPRAIDLQAASHTASALGVEAVDVSFALSNVQWATGALTTQRGMLITAPTYSFVGASVITTAATLTISAAPTAGTNATITSAYAFWVQAGVSAFAAPTTSNASINLPHGTAPSSPANGDMWTTTAGLFLRVNGSTVGPFASGISGAGATDSITVWSGTSSITQLTAFTATNATFAFTQTAQATGTASLAVMTGGAHTNLTLSTEVIDVNYNLARTVQWATGALTTQRAFVVQAPTYAFVGASVITNAATFAISGAPVAGTNATITNARALWVQGGTSRFDGQINMAGAQVSGATGQLEIAPATIATSGTPKLFHITAAANTGMTASTEVLDVQIDLTATRQWATGNITNQRAFCIFPPTYSFVGASVITTAATLSIAGAPIAGTNATITNTYALWVSSGNVLIDAGLTVNSNFAMLGGMSNSAAGMFQLAPSSISTNGTPTLFRIAGTANTGMTASTEVFDINLNLNRTVQWATGNITTQRAMVIQTPAYAFVGASVITNAATLAINGAPIAGTNATITNAYALWIQAGSSRFDGGLLVGGGLVDPAYSSTSWAAAGSLTIGAGIWTTINSNTATIATFAVTMPATPNQGQIITIATSGIVTTFTLNPNSGQTIQGAPVALAANTSIQFVYAGTIWTRLL